ncbi:phospholipid/glycerol acyltransferase [Oscillochloris trichoides DG-6]|uniref:Phospholipid/glycerol acyltransferase n=1 Tax=Oscillochloris trichoides DG-6 TaxID=765420 RepID=E1II88_9CHLR|nr:lysophospholipid acyltransferase family protein [Oscillochloris trichoides]EFO79116.1 phospholipid/glycerol acyltransferase [Oscillochloris trichoides DG-6]
MSESIEIEVAGSAPTPPVSVEIDVSHAPAEAEPTPAQPNKRRSRKRASAEVPVQPNPEPEPSPAPPPPPHPASAWSTQPSEDLFEVELEVRNRAAQAEAPSSSSLGDIAAGLLSLVGENMRRMTEEQVGKVNEMLGGTDLRDYLDPDFWKGIGMVLQYQVQEQVDFIKRRARGEYTIDPYGLDPDIIEIVRPFVSFMYHTWWRVQAQGLENVPAQGRALLVANHSGVLPWDGAMIASAVASEHPLQVGRVVRSLHLHWFTTLPFIAPALAATGQVPGLPENAVRLLENDELVCVFPEGIKGVGKLYKDRYKLARFGRGGFIQVALRTGAPIVPVAVVGAEEIYPMLHNAESIAKMLGFPYFPITPFFPWLGLLGTIPLPTRWNITFCPPISTEEYGPRAADDPLTVLSLAERVRDTIQETINTRLAERTSIF